MISQGLFTERSGAKTLLSSLPAAGGSCVVLQAKSDPPQRTKVLLLVAPGGLNVPLAKRKQSSVSYCHRKCVAGASRGQVDVHGEWK